MTSPDADLPSLRARAAARNPLPEGTASVGMGLVVNGIAAYAFIAIASRTLGEDTYSPLGVMWVITFIAAPGFFLPLEQEIGRALAGRRALGQGGGPLIRRAALLGASLLGVLLIVVAALAPLLVHHLFNDDWLLFIGFALALCCYYAAHLGRGALSGSRQFRAYGTYMAGEGIVRTVAVAALAVAGVHEAGVFGLAVGLPALIAIVYAVRRSDNLMAPGPDAPFSELSTNLGWLLAGSVFAAALVNAGPVAVKLLADASQDEVAGKFVNATIVSRVPLFLFQAVQASLLPKLSALAAAGKFTDFRNGFRRLLIVVFAIAAIGVVGAAVVGPFAIRLVFGPDYDLGRRNLTMLAAAAGLYMVAVAMAQALLALHGHAKVAAGWIGAVGVFVVAVAFGNDLLWRTEVAVVAASASAMVAFGLFLRPMLTGDPVIGEAEVLEALHDLPIEP